LQPNPLNYDGIDSVIIEIWQKENKCFSSQKSVWFTTNICGSIEEAINEVNKKIESIL